jgi:hypothetical protein
MGEAGSKIIVTPSVVPSVRKISFGPPRNCDVLSTLPESRNAIGIGVPPGRDARPSTWTLPAEFTNGPRSTVMGSMMTVSVMPSCVRRTSSPGMMSGV